MEGLKEPLDALRDIHLPQALPWWPPAPGWWLVMSLLLLAAVGLLFFALRRWYRKSQPRRTTLRQIKRLQQRFQSGDTQHVLLAELSELLRKTAVRRFPDRTVGGLLNDDWLMFLAETQSTGNSPPDSRILGPGLLLGPYYPGKTLSDAEMKRLLQLTRRWLVTNA